MSTVCPTEGRDALALRLYAAYVDIAEERIPEFTRMRFPDRTMADWRRVADEALGRREPKRIVPLKSKPIVPVAPFRPTADRLRASQRAEPKAVAAEPLWCAQCDRRVSVANAQSCQSQFCKVNG